MQGLCLYCASWTCLVAPMGLGGWKKNITKAAMLLPLLSSSPNFLSCEGWAKECYYPDFRTCSISPPWISEVACALGPKLGNLENLNQHNLSCRANSKFGAPWLHAPCQFPVLLFESLCSTYFYQFLKVGAVVEVQALHSVHTARQTWGALTKVSGKLEVLWQSLILSSVHYAVHRSGVIIHALVKASTYLSPPSGQTICSVMPCAFVCSEILVG